MQTLCSLWKILSDLTPCVTCRYKLVLAGEGQPNLTNSNENLLIFTSHGVRFHWVIIKQKNMQISDKVLIAPYLFMFVNVHLSSWLKASFNLLVRSTNLNTLFEACLDWKYWVKNLISALFIIAEWSKSDLKISHFYYDQKGRRQLPKLILFPRTNQPTWGWGKEFLLSAQSLGQHSILFGWVTWFNK